MSSGDASLRAAMRVFVTTRVAVLLIAVFAALSFGPVTGGDAEDNAVSFDEPSLTYSVGGVGDPLLTPLARWDAVWFLRIADTGYGDSEARAASFPLCPGLSRGLGTRGGGATQARLMAGYVIALAAFLGAPVLLYRRVALELE